MFQFSVFMRLVILYVHCGSVNFQSKANFELTIVTYHPDNGQRSYKPQTKLAERMLSSSQNYSQIYL